MSLSRVTCTIPSGVLAAADAAAKRLGRSRSWVVSEALKHLTANPAPTAVAETVRLPYGDALAAARASQRDADVALTPAERLLAAEELAAETARLRPRPRIREVLLFDTPEDYFAWKKRDLLW